MADKEVADLTSAGTLDGTESFHLVKGGNSRKSLVSAVLTYIQGAIFGTFGLAFAGNEDATAARGDLGLEDSSTDNTVVRFDGTAGQTQSSGVVVDDSNNVSGVGTLSMGNALTVTEHGSAPSTPASGKAVIYAKADGLIYGKDDAGTETQLSNEATANVDYSLITTLNGAVGTPSTLSATNLSAYDELFVIFKGISHNSGSNQSIRVATSTNNGSSYDTALIVLAAASAATGYHGVMQMSGLKRGYTQIHVVANNSATDKSAPSSGFGTDGHSLTNGTAVNAIQFSPSSGAFDAGTIEVWGR